MSESRRTRLINQGAETLADALLSLAETDDIAEQLVHRLTATPEEQAKRVKARIAGLKRSRRFIDWRGIGGFARDLDALVEDIRAIDDPRLGLELVAAFFKTDRSVFDRCDDSSGSIGDIFRVAATATFAEFAARYDDKDRIVKLILKLLEENDYGARDYLTEGVTGFLPQGHVRKLIDHFQARVDKEADEYRRRHYLGEMETLARQIGDAALFEKSRIAAWGEPGTAACIDIAGVWLECGEAETARLWLEKIRPGDEFRAEKRDKVWLGVCEAQGDVVGLRTTAWRIFRRHRSADSLETLLERIGPELREQVIDEEFRRIQAEPALNIYDARFLLDAAGPEQAQQYLLERREKIYGRAYEDLVSLAEQFVKLDYPLAATVLYRAMLDSILERASTKTYPHGVRYLKKLDKLASQIDNWSGIVSHELYHRQLRQFHGRKTSFWGRYE